MRINPKEQDASERIKNFDDVCLGYSEDEAVSEAKTCPTCGQTVK